MVGYLGLSRGLIRKLKRRESFQEMTGILKKSFKNQGEEEQEEEDAENPQVVLERKLKAKSEKKGGKGK